MPASSFADLILNPEAEGTRLRSNLSSWHVRSLHNAQICFVSSQYLPMLLYYMGTSEGQKKFPASLSYTTSRGLPRWTCLGCWLIGWFFFLRILDFQTDATILSFAIQMILTAGVTAWSNRPGQSWHRDMIHMLAAVLYIADHVVFMELLAITSFYKSCFFASFLIAGMSLYWGRAVKVSAGVPLKYASSASEWYMLLGKLPVTLSKQLWCSEMCFMLAENLIFTSFVLGLTSGLPK